MHESSGCADDGKLTPSTREPHRGSRLTEGMYHTSSMHSWSSEQSKLVVVDDHNALSRRRSQCTVSSLPCELRPGGHVVVVDEGEGAKGKRRRYGIWR